MENTKRGLAHDERKGFQEIGISKDCCVSCNTIVRLADLIVHILK